MSTFPFLTQERAELFDFNMKMSELAWKFIGRSIVALLTGNRAKLARLWSGQFD